MPDHQDNDFIKLPKTVRGKETLNKILTAAEKLFSDNGYHATKITDIVQEANVAPGTFYIYFPNKKSIFDYLMKELGHLLRKEISEASQNSTCRIERERTGFRTFFSFVGKHRGLFRIVWDAQFVDEDAFKAYYEEFADRYVKRIIDAQENGEMRDIDPMSTAYALIGISNFTALKWVIFENKPVPEEVINSIMEFVQNGVFK